MSETKLEHHKHDPFKLNCTSDWAYEHFKVVLPNEDILKVIEHTYALCECGAEYFEILYAAPGNSLRKIVSIDGDVYQKIDYYGPKALVAYEIIKRSLLTSLYMVSSLGFGIAYYANNEDYVSLVASLFLGYGTLKEIINSTEIDKLKTEREEMWKKYEKALIED